MKTRIQRISADALDIRRGPRPLGLLGAAAALTVWLALLLWRGPESRDGLALWVTGVFLVPWVALRVWRGSRRERHVLTRGGGRLVLDGQPLDVARIETRLVRHWLLRLPRGFAVSLWGMEVDGRPVELELGRHATLMDAARAAGELEEFLELARAERPQRAR
jgi:hypothetical protein